MNLNSVEGSIQNLLSVLYPPFDATAPTLLSQLFQIIGSHYRGDALRCFLDFLVPAKHILDTVQQAACAQFSQGLFLYEGWPLCLHDQIVVHLAPIDALLLQPGDFYLQVAPFCDQSARILVCSLLEEEGCTAEIEETPIPETSYPCIFSSDWLDEINHGRHGTPLRQCLLTTEQGLVRLPWERVAVPNFVAVPRSSHGSMASAPPPHPSQPLPPPLDCSASSSFSSFSQAATLKQSPPASRPSVFSVETRICPAKHGIAVSLCLVGTNTASSSQLVKGKEAETETKPIGWVSPNTWDSRFSEKNRSTTTNTNIVPDISPPAKYDVNDCKGVIVSEERLQKKAEDMSKSGSVSHTYTEGEYIDVLQASRLFCKDLSSTEEKLHAQIQPQVKTEARMQKDLQIKGQRSTQLPQHKPSHAPVQVPMTSNHSKNAALVSTPDMIAETETPRIRQRFHAHPDHLDSQCLRTVQFAEKPCTPCMKRRQAGKASRSEELRCRFRDSYQAALQNPVAFKTEKDKDNRLSVLEEDKSEKHRSQETETENPWCRINKDNPKTSIQSTLSVREDICEESEEINTVLQWKQEVSDFSACADSKTFNSSKSEKTNFSFQESQSTKNNDIFHNTNKTLFAAGVNTSIPSATTSMNSPPSLNVSTKCHTSATQVSGSLITFMNHKRPENQTSSTSVCPHITSQTAQEQRLGTLNRRCSSLSTAVVNTSEKCELVIVEGNNIRRKENINHCAEIPQLHVVKCKNSTAFRLVSPKINRKKITVGDQPAGSSVSQSNSHLSENQTKTDSSPKPEIQKITQNASGQARPDHLPLGSRDPGAHPVYQGLARLTGCRDRTGRTIVEFYGDHRGWRTDVTSQELHQMLLYFYSITRKELREVGMTLIFDARRTNPQPQLYKALMTLQEQYPSAVTGLVLLVNKENNFWPEKCPGIQTDVVTSMKALLKLVEVNHLTSCLGGTATHSPCNWEDLHQKLFPFVNDLHEASSLLLRAISNLEEPQRTETVQTVQMCMTNQRTLMKDVLEDIRLVSLQREGGAMLARLRKESDLRYPDCEDLSDAVDSVTSLYNFVEEQAHVLVQRTNMSLEHLDYLLQLRELEGHLTEIQHWFAVEGEKHLLDVDSVEDSGDRLEEILNSFTAFLMEANDRRHNAMLLMSEAESIQQNRSSYPETETFRTFICSFKLRLDDFLCRAETSGRELQTMISVCDFCEQATTLATECTDYLNQNQFRIHTEADPQANETSHLVKHQDQESSDVHAAQSGINSSRVSSTSTDTFILQAFQERFLHFNSEKFQEVKSKASGLRGSQGMRVWNAAWLKCQEAQQQLQETMQELDGVLHRQDIWTEGHFVDVVNTNVQNTSGGQNLVVQSTPGPQHPQWEGIVSGAADLGSKRPVLSGINPNTTSVACCNVIIKSENTSDAGTRQDSKTTPQSPHRSAKKAEKEVRRRQMSRARSERDAAALSQTHTVGCQWFQWGRGLKGRSVSQDSCASRMATAGSSTSSEQQSQPSSCSHHGQPSCRILQEAQKFQISRHGSFCSEDSYLSDQGASGGSRSLCCKHASLPITKHEAEFSLGHPQESSSSSLRLQRVVEELVFTEREYVRSLGYILNHYLPLMDRIDIPQDLRGKRGVIFGNLEKLYNFHNLYFLPELEACEREPAMVARCFLRHSESFGLYALYSKNKPQSDALILHRRHDIFKKKQQELGDMMDLSSYLLRPIQRISKYNLLLQDMLSLTRSPKPKDVAQDAMSPSDVCSQNLFEKAAPNLTNKERGRAEIQAAADLVRFQMRHGNDLLTMDAILDCDVNLKEQGQLVRQDEFTVFFRKKKCVRRIFLFEDLILFSKPRRTDVGNDVYVYKQSFKTNDIGMTHNSAMSSLCFEIWFRRRKSGDTYTLKASNLEVKKAWTSDLERLLWDQAAHSRELRLQERVLMGMDRKPFMDIQPSDSAICNRAVSCTLPGRVPVACCSHRGLDYPRPHSIGSGSTASTTISQSSSSSGRGSLPPAGYPGNPSQGVDVSFIFHSTPEAVTNNELNNLHQQYLHEHCEQWKSLRPLIDNTESSGESTNVFSSFDRSCLSAISAEIEDDSSTKSKSPQHRPPLCGAPSLKRYGLTTVAKKKPALVPKPPQLDAAQENKITIGKSTQV